MLQDHPKARGAGSGCAVSRASPARSGRSTVGAAPSAAAGGRDSAAARAGGGAGAPRGRAERERRERRSGTGAVPAAPWGRAAPPHRLPITSPSPSSSERRGRAGVSLLGAGESVAVRGQRPSRRGSPRQRRAAAADGEGSGERGRRGGM